MVPGERMLGRRTSHPCRQIERVEKDTLVQCRYSSTRESVPDRSNEQGRPCRGSVALISVVCLEGEVLSSFSLSGWKEERKKRSVRLVLTEARLLASKALIIVNHGRTLGGGAGGFQHVPLVTM